MAPRLYNTRRGTPHCFCEEPASPAYSEEFGLIYECAYMHQNFWRKAADDHSNFDRKANENSGNPRKSKHGICGFHIHKDTWDSFFDYPDRINPYHPELSTCPFFNFTFCAYFRKRNNFPLGHPPPPRCFCGTTVLMRYSRGFGGLMFACPNYLIDGAKPKCTWHVWADHAAFERPKGCTHPIKKQVTVGLVEPENMNNNIPLEVLDSDPYNEYYIDPRGPMLNGRGHCFPKNQSKNKNFNCFVNRRESDYNWQDTHNNGPRRYNNRLKQTLKPHNENGYRENSYIENHKTHHHSPNQDNHSDSQLATNSLRDDDHYIASSSQTPMSNNCNTTSNGIFQPHITSSSRDSTLKNNNELYEYVSQLEADNKNLLDQISKLKTDNKSFSEKADLLADKAEKLESKVTDMQLEINRLNFRLGHYRSECGSEVEKRQSCQKKVIELQSRVSDVSKENNDLKLLREREREERVSATHKCKVCFSEPITHAIFPCHHMALCGTCVNAVDKCVICRQNKESVVRIYIQ